MFGPAPPLPSLCITHSLALSGQCIVDHQQCTVGSGPVVGLRGVHASVDDGVGFFFSLKLL